MSRRSTLSILSAAAFLILAAPLALAEEAQAPLMPDIHDSSTYFQALWVLIIFVILLAVLYPTAWKNVLAGLKAREERIRGAIAEAEASRGKAEQSLKEYNVKLAQAEERTRELIATATGEGEKIATQI